MAGISSKALKSNYAENKRKFNGGNELQSKEFSDGSGLETYDAVHRMYDPQIGRFHQIDPLGELNESWSSYSFVNDNPILLNDPLGLKNDSTPAKIEPPAASPNNANVEVPVVVGCHPCKTPTQSSSSAGAAFFVTGVTDTYYGIWESKYDHNNYTTIKGNLKPFPWNRPMSRQAKMFKQRSNIVSRTALSLSLASNIITAVQVRNQYLEGGVSNVDPVDVTGLVLGTSGLTASALSKFNLFPQTLSTISSVAGTGSIVLVTYQNWMTAFQIMYNTNLPNAPAYNGNANEQFQAALDDAASGGNRWDW